MMIQKKLKSVLMYYAGNSVPALSCGFHPGPVEKVTEIAGADYLANAGGAVHGHPGGTVAGARAMRQAIAKWGLIQ